jgi:hypothetical protein
MENDRYLMKVVIGRGLLEYIKVGKLPASNIVLLQFHIHGTNSVLYYFWFHSVDNIDIKMKYY